jgi:hypothetical protein
MPNPMYPISTQMETPAVIKRFFFWGKVILLFMGLHLIITQAPAADSPIGCIKTAQNNASILRSGNSIPAQIGVMVYTGDILQTDQTGSLGVIFRDDALVSLGPNSQVKIDDFVFQPDQRRFSFLSRLIQGTAAFVSGQIAKLAPETMQVQTPIATIGVRGTRFAVQAEGGE